MKKRIINIFLTLILILTSGVSVITAYAVQTTEDASLFTFYGSQNETMSYNDGALSTTPTGEQKTMINDFNSRLLDVSFRLTPNSSNALLNGGIYLFADNVGAGADSIDALNVQVERGEGADSYSVRIFDFTNGAYNGCLSNTHFLTFNGFVDVRVIATQTHVLVYLDGSNVPTIQKNITATTHLGNQIGFRSQFASQTFSNISISKTATPPECETVKVLMIGNSYAQDTMTYAHEIARADGINMVCGVLYYGGCTVRQHVDFFKSGKAVYKYFKNGGTDLESASFFDVLYDEDWDYITIQTGQGEQGLESTFYPYLPWLIAQLENLLPSAEIGLFQSWAVPSCYEGTNNSRLSKYDDNSEKMYNSILTTFSNLHKDNGTRFVVPSAEAFHRINQTNVCDNSVFETSFFRDSTAHANEKGRYMLGLTMYRTITGNPVTGNTYAPVGFTYGADVGPDASVREVIQNTVDSLFESYESANVPAQPIATLESIEVQNAKTAYRVGEYFAYNQIKVIAHYSDGSTAEIIYYVGSILRRLTAEDTSVIITYQNKTATVEITVN